MVSGIFKNIENWIRFIAISILPIADNQMYKIHHNNHAKNDAVWRHISITAVDIYLVIYITDIIKPG